MEKPLRIGVLAVQGNFREHAAVLRRLGAEPVEVRLPEQLDGLDGLIIPGGESTTIGRLMRLYGLDEAVREFGGPILGTCAGMIVLDRDHLGLGDYARGATRSAARSTASKPISRSRATSEPLRAVFIRAPWLEEAGADVEVLAEVDGHPVLAREGRLLVAAFHPELTDDTRVHERFLNIVRRSEVSGHSKWSSIKHKKGAADAKRGKLFSKLTRAIIVAAKEGGPDPAGNLALQNAVEKAKAALDAEGQHRPRDREGRRHRLRLGLVRDIVYEGYGPGGVAVIVETLTDNRNRTAGEVRHTFAKNDGNLGTSGAVAWLFERRGVVLVPADGTDEDELTLAAAEGGADDVSLDGSSYQVLSARRAARHRARGSRGCRLRDRVGRADDAPEDDGRRRGRERGEEDPAPDRPARGERRRARGLRELRHSRTSPRERGRLEPPALPSELVELGAIESAVSVAQSAYDGRRTG